MEFCAGGAAQLEGAAGASKAIVVTVAIFRVYTEESKTEFVFGNFHALGGGTRMQTDD